MRVDHIMVLVPAIRDHLTHLILIGPAGAEQGTNLGQHRFGNLIGAPLVQIVHQHGDQTSVLVGHVIQHAFQIRGDKNVHRRGNRLIERTLTVIRAGSQEIEQHIVLIGRNNQMLDRQA